jgi:hypothetical protein
MGLHEAEAGMLTLEGAECPFDYGKSDYYRTRVQEYLKYKNASFPGQPVLLDPSQGKAELPTQLGDRVEKWMARHPEYSPYMRTFARNYLISLLDDDGDTTLYRPLAECVITGADFYLESGMMYLRDAIAVPTTA